MSILRKAAGYFTFSVCGLLLLAIVAGVAGFKLFPFAPVTPPALPAHTTVVIDHYVGTLTSIEVDIGQVHGNRFTVEVAASVVVAAHSSSDTANLTLYWPVVVSHSSTSVPTRNHSYLSAASSSGANDEFHWKVEVPSGANGVAIINDTVLFGLPNVQNFGGGDRGTEATVNRYLVGEPDSPALAWLQNSPNVQVPHASKIGWANDSITPGQSTGSFVAQGSDLAIAQGLQVSLFLSGALLAIAGGALVAVIPEVGRRREQIRTARSKAQADPG